MDLTLLNTIFVYLMVVVQICFHFAVRLFISINYHDYFLQNIPKTLGCFCIKNSSMGHHTDQNLAALFSIISKVLDLNQGSFDNLRLSVSCYYVFGTLAFAGRCTSIRAVGKPVTHHVRRSTQGAWMKDPLGVMGSETIFVMESYHGRDVLEFENMAKLKAGITRKTYKLPYQWDGTGGVVFGQYLYYNRLVVRCSPRAISY